MKLDLDNLDHLMDEASATDLVRQMVKRIYELALSKISKTGRRSTLPPVRD